MITNNLFKHLTILAMILDVTKVHKRFMLTGNNRSSVLFLSKVVRYTRAIYNRMTLPIRRLDSQLVNISLRGDTNTQRQNNIKYFPLNITRYLNIKDYFFPISVPESQGLSGLLNIPPEWYNIKKDGTKELACEAKQFILIVYSKVLFTLAYHNVTDNASLVKHAHELLKSCNQILQELFNNSRRAKLYISRYMGTLQHTLVAIFLKHEISIELFKELTKNKVDFNLYKTGDILLLIETIVLLKNFEDLLDKLSFTAINHNFKFEKIDTFNRQHCKEVTGQENSDWYATQGIIDKNGIQIEGQYNDVKMYESDALKGRLSLKPGLVSNKIAFREYITKYQTSIPDFLESNQGKKIPRDHFIYRINTDIQEEVNNILRAINKMPVDQYGNFKNKSDVKKVKEILGSFNTKLKKYLIDSNIKNKINLGVSNDPDIDHEYIRVYNECFKDIIQSEDFLNQFDYTVLMSRNFYLEAHRAQLEILSKHFPSEIVLKIAKIPWFSTSH